MGEDIENNVPFVERTPSVLLLIGTIGVVLWIGVKQSAMSNPVAEIPLVLAGTCFLGAISLSVTKYIVKNGTSQIDTSRNEHKWLPFIGTIGTVVILLLVGLSFVALLNGVAYFVLDRNWFVSPAEVGGVQFFFLVGIVLTPAVVGGLSVSLRVYCTYTR